MTGEVRQSWSNNQEEDYKKQAAEQKITLFAAHEKQLPHFFLLRE